MPEVNPQYEKVMLVYLTQPDADYQVQGEMNYRMKRVPQLGLQYLAGMLKNEGIEPEMLDQALQTFGPGDVVRKWRSGCYGFVGFYTDTSMKEKVWRFVEALAAMEPGIAVVVGGPGYPGYADYHKAGVDIVCHGEGEQTVVDIASIYRGNRSHRGTPGISWMNEGIVEVEKPRPLIENLDDLPFPDRSGAPISSYYDWHFFGMRTPFVTNMAARGCPNRCTFCCSPALGKRIRRRSVGNLMREVDTLTSRFGLRYMGFKDDIFVFNKTWLEEFCDALLKRNSPIQFSCNMHPLSFRKDADKFVPLMKRAGLDLAVFGIQSVTPHILKGIRRNEEEPRRLAELGAKLKKQEVSIVYEFILGLPGDTEETVENTLRYALKTRPHYSMFYTLSILEGSEIHKEFGNESVCEIPRQRQQNLASTFARRFFFHPLVLLQNILHVIRKNPYWIWRNLKMAWYFIEATGIISKRKPEKIKLES